MTSQPFHFEPIHTDQYVVTGDVVIAEGVAIAPGVLLQADSGSRIVLSSGVCLGMGCVIHANGGEVRIDAGVNLGAGVLVVGRTHIGPGAIVGAGTTVFGQSIMAGTVVAPNSLLVDTKFEPSVPLQTTSTCEPREPTNKASEEVAPEKTAPKKVNVEGSGFFFSKGRNSAPATPVIEDPWASEAIPEPVNKDATTFSPETKPNFNTSDIDSHNTSASPGIEEPIVSTFVYPNDNCTPKHAWQVSSDASLGNPIPEVDTAEVPQPQPNPDSDLSAEEMQNGGGNTATSSSTPETNGALVQHKPKQVYGQAYVNQMLGKMMGKN